MTSDRTGRALAASVSAVVVSGLTLAGLTAVTMSAKVPTVLAPISFPLVVAELQYPGAAVWISAVAFWLVSVRLFLGDEAVPAHSLALFGGVVVADAVWLVVHAARGVMIQGAWHTAAVIVGNGLAASCLAWLAWSGRRSPGFWKSLAFHWGLFAWLSWYAFPYLGELI
ncbi:MAG TPA: hypothetical protein VE404_01815 [Verrucomicrobiae bacterium]|nr:hypothetical protein [Verrucomicrobiae bacterium]